VFLALAAVGAICVYLRLYHQYRTPLTDDPGKILRLGYTVEFEPTNPTERLYINLPSNTACAKVVNESFSHRGLTIDVLRNTDTSDREIVAVASGGKGAVRFTAEFDIILSQQTNCSADHAETSLTTPQKAKYLKPHLFFKRNEARIMQVLDDISRGAGTRAQLIERIYEHCSENIEQMESSVRILNEGRVIRNHWSRSFGCAEFMIALCRAARIPARLVTGFVLENRPGLQPSAWVEVYRKKRWKPYDPYNGYSGELAPNYLPVRHGGGDIIRISDNSPCVSCFSLEPIGRTSSLAHSSDKHIGNILSLTRLPVSMKKTLALILMLPVGALVTSVFRNLIGLQTFGTFAPTLIALSLVSSDWRTGLIVFVLTLATGLLSRVLLSGLNMLAVPRLGIILTVVILCLVMSVSVCEYAGIAPTARSILLPVVIITMMIERFFIMVEEDGLSTALKVLVGTGIVAVCCFTVLNSAPLGAALLAFPETLLFVMAAFVLVGRYSGYRLSELWRFRDFALGKDVSGRK